MRKKDFRRMKLGRARKLTAGLTNHEHPAVARRARHFAFYAGEYGSIGIYVTTPRGLLARCVSPAVGNSTQPAWRPDGGALAYRHQHTPESPWELWETELHGAATQPRQLLADRKWHYKHPSYSPDAASIAYFTNEGSTSGAYHLWLLERSTGTRRQVSFGDTQMHCHPVFSPDGTRLAYHAYEGTDENRTPPVTNLCELDLRTGETRVLTTGTDQYKHPFYIDAETLTLHHERNTDCLRRLAALHLPSLELRYLTSGKDNDKHPFPFFDRKGRLHLTWASKKLGAELPAEENSCDIFVARIEAR